MRPAAQFQNNSVYMAGGQYWQEYDVAPYTSRFPAAVNAEQAIREWIMRETGPEVWHGADVSALTVSGQRVRVYHQSQVQARVADVLGRFLYYEPGRFQCRARIVQVRDPKWRTAYGFAGEIPASGDKKQAWLLDSDEADKLVGKLVKNGAVLLAEPQFLVANGQEAKVQWSPGGSQSSIESSATGGFGMDRRPLAERAGPGVVLRFSPLIAQDAATIELELDLSLATKTLTKEPGLLSIDRSKYQVSELRAAAFGDRYRLPPKKQMLLSLGLAPEFEPKKGLFHKERPAEVLVILSIVPDQAGAMQPPVAATPANNAARTSAKPKSTGSGVPQELTRAVF